MNRDESPDARCIKAKVYGLAVALLVVLYVSSYFLISMQGRFEPAAVGIRGVKWWLWAPRGFPDYLADRDMTWQWIYVPLWRLDCRFWHNDKKTGVPGYPIRQWDKAATPPAYRVINP